MHSVFVVIVVVVAASLVEAGHLGGVMSCMKKHNLSMHDLQNAETTMADPEKMDSMFGFMGCAGIAGANDKTGKMCELATSSVPAEQKAEACKCIKEKVAAGGEDKDVGLEMVTCIA